MISAEEARRLVKNNEKRQRLIKEYIKNGEETIKDRVEKGRRETYISYGSGSQQWPEVLEHFRKLGYRITTDETNIAKVEW